MQVDNIYLKGSMDPHKSKEANSQGRSYIVISAASQHWLATTFV